MTCPRAQSPLTPSNLDLGAIIRLTDRKRKQTERVSGQNRIATCEVIEPDPSIANPDHTWAHVVSNVGLCPKLSPLIVNLDRITVGEPTRICVEPGYPKLWGSIVLYQRRQGLSLVVERMEVCQCPSEAQRQRIRGALVNLVHREWW